MDAGGFIRCWADEVEEVGEGVKVSGGVVGFVSLGDCWDGSWY